MFLQWVYKIQIVNKRIRKVIKDEILMIHLKNEGNSVCDYNIKKLWVNVYMTNAEYHKC